ncbi:MAG: HAD family hydrolase [Phycisphaerae bacterium]|nr:HAD family hydrolase [Phycisphaerae bacterium]
MTIQAAIFDMDGTLTVPHFDFDAIREEIGGISGPILEAMEKMSPDEYRRAHEILLKHEALAANKSELNSGVYEMMAFFKETGIKTGIVTRNNLKNVEIVCDLHDLFFDTIVTREDGPPKPDPYPVQLACERLGVDPKNAVMVGDFLFDIISGRDAGAYTVLLTTSPDSDEFKHEADYVIDSLGELPGIITGIMCK